MKLFILGWLPAIELIFPFEFVIELVLEVSRHFYPLSPLPSDHIVPAV